MANFTMSAPYPVIDELSREAQRRGISRCALVREAISLHLMLSGLSKDRARVFVERDGQRTEVLVVGLSPEDGKKSKRKK